MHPVSRTIDGLMNAVERGPTFVYFVHGGICAGFLVAFRDDRFRGCGGGNSYAFPRLHVTVRLESLQTALISLGCFSAEDCGNRSDQMFRASRHDRRYAVTSARWLTLVYSLGE